MGGAIIITEIIITNEREIMEYLVSNYKSYRYLIRLSAIHKINKAFNLKEFMKQDWLFSRVFLMTIFSKFNFELMNLVLNNFFIQYPNKIKDLNVPHYNQFHNILRYASNQYNLEQFIMDNHECAFFDMIIHIVFKYSKSKLKWMSFNNQYNNAFPQFQKAIEYNRHFILNELLLEIDKWFKTKNYQHFLTLMSFIDEPIIFEKENILVKWFKRIGLWYHLPSLQFLTENINFVQNKTEVKQQLLKLEAEKLLERANQSF